MQQPQATYFRQLHQHHQRGFSAIMLASAVLLAVAYLTHLGLLPVDPRTDETRRALVTLEMMEHGQYLVPTLNGETYLNKPPLYNWIIMGSYHLFGVTPFALRFPVIVFIFCYAGLIFFYFKKYWNQYAAALVAMMFATNGRILIYDSIQGLIDVCYSMLIFWSFMLTWHYGEKKAWLKLFLSTYLLCAIGFLMKGLPSVVFQAISLGAYFLGLKKWWWKPLFSWMHAAGAVVFLTIVGAYFYAYFHQANVSPGLFFKNMFNENSSRTFVNSSPLQFVVHLLTYPFTLVYHFAPWALLLLVLLRKNLLGHIQRREFVWFMAFCFAGGLLIYWLSPNIMARYLFMILPPMYALCMQGYAQLYPSGWQVKCFDYTLLILLLAIALGSWALPFVPVTASLPLALPKVALLFVVLLAIVWMAWHQPLLRLAWFTLALVVLRFGFNWFVIENRGSYQRSQQAHAQRVVQLAAGKPVHLQRGADLGNWDGLSYYYLLQTGSILRFADTLRSGDLLITDSASASAYPHRRLYAWPGHIQQRMLMVEKQAHK